MPEMTRFCPGCAQRRLQMNTAPCEICGRVNLVTAPRPREKMHFLARVMRALLRPLGWRVHALTGVFCALAVWAMRVHWITPFSGWEQSGLIISALLLAIIWGGRLFLRGAVWLFAPATRVSKRPGAQSFAVLPLCVALLWWLNLHNVPLRVGFWLSRGVLESVAMAPYLPLLVPGAAVDGSRLYEPRLGIVYGNNVQFDASENEFIGSGTKAGFAKCPQGCGVANFPDNWSDWNAPLHYIHLADDWYWWEQAGSDF